MSVAIALVTRQNHRGLSLSDNYHPNNYPIAIGSISLSKAEEVLKDVVGWVLNLI